MGIMLKSVVCCFLMITAHSETVSASGETNSTKVSASSVSYLPGSPVRREAERLAAEGYVALAVDLYDGMVATTLNEARAAMRKVTQ